MIRPVEELMFGGVVYELALWVVGIFGECK